MAKKRTVTPAMVAAGEAVLFALEGQASKEFVAEEVYLAMERCRLSPSVVSLSPTRGSPTSSVVLPGR